MKRAAPPIPDIIAHVDTMIATGNINQYCIQSIEVAQIMS